MSLIHEHRRTGSARPSVVIGQTRLSDLSSDSDIEIRSGGESVFGSRKVPNTDDAVFETAIADLLDEVRRVKLSARRRR